MPQHFPPSSIHSYNMKKRTSTFILFFATSITLFTVLIYGVKPALHRKFCGSYCFRLLRPAPYQSGNYFSKEFIESSFKYPAPALNAEGVLYTPEFESKWINSKNGQRFTTDLPPSFTKTIYIFGGSSLANVEVPDHSTIPSYLQRKFQVDKIRVVNLGYAGAQIKHQFQKLKSIKTNKGDLIIFYDGINESIAHMLLRGGMNPVSDQKTETQLINIFEGPKKRYVKILQKIRNYLNSINFFTYWFGSDPIFLLQNNVPNHLQSEQSVQQLQLTLNEELISDLKEVKKYCDQNGLIFMHIFQPILTENPSNTSYEKMLLNRSSIIPKSFNLAFKYSLPVFEDVSKKLKFMKINSINMTHFLDKRVSYSEVYLDYGHLNHEGNEFVASEIYNEILLSDFDALYSPYIKIFNSLDNVLTDHEKADKVVFSQKSEGLCHLFAQYIDLKNLTVDKILDADEKICSQVIGPILKQQKNFCEHDQVYWKRALIRWTVDKSCRGKK